MKALWTVKYCAQSLIAFVVIAEAYLFIIQPDDDIARGVFMSLIMIVVFGLLAITAMRFEGVLQDAIGKSLNKIF